MVDDTLLSYLSSSSGLSSLRIAFSYSNTDPHSSLLASRLFTSALPRHGKTLKRLFVLVPPGNALCVQKEWCKSLLACKALEEMRLSIAVHSETQEADVHTLLQLTPHLPHLHTLGLLYYIVGFWCGTGYSAAFREGETTLKSSLSSFSPDSTSFSHGHDSISTNGVGVRYRYPKVSIMQGDVKYEMTAGEDEWRYRVHFGDEDSDY